MKYLNRSPFEKEEIEKPYKFRGDIIEIIFKEIELLERKNFYEKFNKIIEIKEYLIDINSKKIIMDKIKEYFPYKISEPNYITNDFSVNYIVSILCVDYLDRFLKLRIFEIDDDYFIADVYTFKDGGTYSRIFFKCDQLVGIFALLLDIKEILDRS